ncbi:hypothetical protein H6P81_002000 [Aristolochia fimbriata]|uniref:Uncharacterized protein n=1 Tax=Aristolochia fimbriata TaxID=158543 RepID=A0AAV7F8K1_ARIFI|nr:hypothetical protein H6P81_002000 [Aristolochia fimbriata]
MGTEVLRPQDCLIDRMRIPDSHVVFPRRSAGRPRPNRKPAARPEVRKQRVPETQKKSTEDATKAGRGFVMGHVTILKRGESLPEKKIRELAGPNTAATPATAAGDLILCGTQRLGPDPATLPIYPSDVYAGSAFFNSPAPSDLPLPSFSKKKCGPGGVVDDSATKDLRRLLRLD